MPGLEELMVSPNTHGPSSLVTNEFLGKFDNQIINKYVKTHCGQDNVQEVPGPMRVHNWGTELD